MSLNKDQTNPKDEVGEITPHIYDRVIKILEFKNEYPDMDWKEDPELVHIENSEGKISSIKYLDFFENPQIDGIRVNINYIPTELSPRRVKNTDIRDCERISFDISDKEQIKTIKDLYGNLSAGMFGITDSDGNEQREDTIEILSEAGFYKEAFRLLLEELKELKKELEEIKQVNSQ